MIWAPPSQPHLLPLLPANALGSSHIRLCNLIPLCLFLLPFWMFFSTWQIPTHVLKLNPAVYHFSCRTSLTHKKQLNSPSLFLEQKSTRKCYRWNSVHNSVISAINFLLLHACHSPYYIMRPWKAETTAIFFQCLKQCLAHGPFTKYFLVTTWIGHL